MLCLRGLGVKTHSTIGGYSIEFVFCVELCDLTNV